MITGTQTWDQAYFCEPSMWWDGSKWNLIYRGGAGTSARIGYATNSNTVPTIAADWTLYASNPIIGGGVGSFSDAAYCPSILLDGGDLYVFFADQASGGDIYLASGTDALHLGTPTVALTNTGSALANTWVSSRAALTTRCSRSRTPVSGRSGSR